MIGPSEVLSIHVVSSLYLPYAILESLALRRPKVAEHISVGDLALLSHISVPNRGLPMTRIGRT